MIHYLSSLLSDIWILLIAVFSRELGPVDSVEAVLLGAGIFLGPV